MSAALLTLLVVAFIGGLAVLAQMARKSLGADVTLIVVVLALSVLGAALGTVTGLGLLLMAVQRGSGRRAWGWGASRVCRGRGHRARRRHGGVGLCIPPLRRVTGRQSPEAGFWADPPLFLALWLFVVVLGNNVVSLSALRPVARPGRPTPHGQALPYDGSDQPAALPGPGDSWRRLSAFGETRARRCEGSATGECRPVRLA